MECAFGMHVFFYKKRLFKKHEAEGKRKLRKI